MNRITLEECREQSRNAPSHRRTHENVANPSDLPFDTKDAVVEGKDAAFDADDDRCIQDLRCVDGLMKMLAGPGDNDVEEDVRTLRKPTICPGWTWITASTCLPAPK